MGDISQSFERLAWEGVVSGRTAVVLAVLIAVVAAWFLWRERQAIGLSWAAGFWVLRMVAFGCALWMLAGPTQLQIERTTSTQSIAIFADASDSMDIVDPPSPTEAVRWAYATSAENAAPVVSCDRLSVSLAAAAAECGRLAQYVEEHRTSAQLQQRAAAVGAAVDRAGMHARALAEGLDRGEPSFPERAQRIVAVVEGPVRDSLTAIGRLLDRSDRVASDEFRMHVEQLVESVTSARRRALVLAGDLSQSASASNTAAVESMSRREKVAKALDALEKQVRGSLGERVRVDRFRFDRAAMPVGAETGWEPALARITAEDQPIEAAEIAAGLGNGAVTGPATNLSAVLERLASGRMGASARLAVVLSDGRHNDLAAPLPQELAAQLAHLPIFVVPIGNAVPVRDVLLHRVEAPSAVTEKDSAVIDVIVSSFDCDGLNSSIVLRHGGREIDRKPIEFSGGRGDQRARFTVPAEEVGWQEYVVEVEPVDDEVNTANNFQPVSFEVVRGSVRVLLADGMARWEYRYLNQLFRREEHVEFDELLFNPRPVGTGELAKRPELPRNVDGWARYDVVILGDLDPRHLPPAAQQALDEYVRKRGGNLIVIAGTNFMPAAFAKSPLADLLPVEPARDLVRQQGYTLRLTDEGRFNSALLIAESPHESRRMWHDIYQRFPVFGLSEYCRPRPVARTLIAAVPETESFAADEIASADVTHAFLCWQRAGAGRVAYLAAPDTYRLRWRRGDRMHHRFWGQVLRWITAASSGAGNDLVRLQTDRTRYAQGDPVEVTVWLKDPTGRPLEGETLEAEARTFQDERKTLDLVPDPEIAGRYFGSFTGLAAGAYEISVGGPIVNELVPAGSDALAASHVRATISISATDNLEMLNTQCNRALLEQIAQVTGGQVIPPTAMAEVLELVSFTPDVQESVRRRPLWTRWSNLLIVLGCLFTEWIVRKSKGLV